MDTLTETADIMRLLADSTRIRLAMLLDGNQLSVAEITQITEMPQSRVSTHLGKLRDASILRDRHEGTSTYYTLNDIAMPEKTRRLWNLVAESCDEPLLKSDRARCKEVLQARHKGENWPENVAGQMDRYYSPGRTWEATLLSFLSYLRLGSVLDAGSGDGTMAFLLAPHCQRITCLDQSPKVLQAARRRLQGLTNVDFAPGDIHALPFADAHFDHVLLLHVLTYARDPVLALKEAARVLRPGGDIIISTLALHDHASVTAAYGHVNQGFRPQVLRAWLAADVGLTVERCEVTSREKRPPHFEVISAFARKTDSLPQLAKESK